MVDNKELSSKWGVGWSWREMVAPMVWRVLEGGKRGIPGSVLSKHS